MVADKNGGTDRGKGGKIPTFILLVSLLAGLAGIVVFGGKDLLPDSLNNFTYGAFERSNSPDNKTVSVVMPRRDSTVGYYLSGRHAQYRGDVENAAYYFEKAAQRDRKNNRLLENAYSSLVLAGNIQEALRLAEKIKDSDDVVISGKLLLLLAEIKEGNLEKVAEMADELPLRGVNITFVPMLSLRLAAENTPMSPGKAERAEQRKTLSSHLKTLELTGKFMPMVQHNMALIEQEAGNHNKAMKWWKKLAAGDISRLNYHYIQHLALAYSDYDDGDGNDDSDDDANGDNEGEDSAASGLQEIMQLYEGTTGGIFLKRLLANPQEARRGFLGVNTVRENVAEMFYSFAVAMDEMGVTGEAVAYSQIALYLRPSHEAARLLLGDVMSNAKHYRQAIELYRDISSASGYYYYKGRVNEAYANWMQGKKEKAMHLLKKLANDEPELADAVLAMADLLRNESRFTEAAKLYSEAIERVGDIGSKLWPVLYARGICYERAGQWDKAEPDFLKALDLKPGQADVLNYLGYSWLIQGRNIARAKEMIEAAITVRPQDAHIIDSMGWALYNLGEFEQALEYMEQAISLAPRDATLNDHLGDIYWRLGRKTEARFQWQRALNFEPEEPGAEERLKEKLEKGLPDFIVPDLAGENTGDDVSALSSPSVSPRPETVGE